MAQSSKRIDVNDGRFSVFYNSFQELSKNLADHYFSSKFALKEYPAENIFDKIVMPDFTLIMLGSAYLQFTVKVFFSSRSIYQKFKKKLKIQDDLDTNTILVKDFMKEFNNQLSGYLKGQIQDAIDLKLSMSLPLVMNGFDDLFSSFPKPMTKYFYWSLIEDDCELVFCVELYSNEFDLDQISKMSLEPCGASTSANDDVEFFS